MIIQRKPRGAIALVLMALALVLLAACGGEPRYPAHLVMADSAMVQGDYRRADSLLALYDSHHSADRSEARRSYRRLLAAERLYTDGRLNPGHFAMVDSLCQYYEDFGTYDKYARSLLFLGQICSQNGDNPATFTNYLASVGEARSPIFLPLFSPRRGLQTVHRRRRLTVCEPRKLPMCRVFPTFASGKPIHSSV